MVYGCCFANYKVLIGVKFYVPRKSFARCHTFRMSLHYLQHPLISDKLFHDGTIADNTKWKIMENIKVEILLILHKKYVAIN